MEDFTELIAALKHENGKMTEEQKTGFLSSLNTYTDAALDYHHGDTTVLLYKSGILDSIERGNTIETGHRMRSFAHAVQRLA